LKRELYSATQARASCAGFFILESIMSWTEDRVTTLKRLWAEGESASAIAATLGEVTRNAVIGKVHRLGLAGRTTTLRRCSTARRSLSRHRPDRRTYRAPSLALKAVPRTRAKPVLPELSPAPEIPVTVQTLTDRKCRWPDGDPKLPDFHFCGRSTMGSSGPYCAAHAAIAYH
jgi:GcrA cell cycle regulator